MRRCVFALWCLCLLPAWASATCSTLAVSGNPEYPPVLWVRGDGSGALAGVAVELLEDALKGRPERAQVRYVGAWSRVQQEAREGRLDMIAGAFITDERQTWMDYIQPAFLVMPNVVFVRKDAPFTMNSWDDLRGKHGDTLINNSFGQAFDAYAREHLEIEGVASIEQAFARLLLGRTDYVLYEQYQGYALAEAGGFADRITHLASPISSEGLYFTLSKKSPCNTPQLRAHLTEKVRELVAQGVPAQRIQPALARWLESRGAPTPP